jgi:hypothetical protein
MADGEVARVVRDATVEIDRLQARLAAAVAEAWVIMFGDEHLMAPPMPGGDICESCGEGWPCTVVEWGAKYREATHG